MYVLAALTVTAILSSQLPYVVAFPLENNSPLEINSLHKRVLGDQNNPHQIEINCAGVESVCEARCLAMLCFGVPNPYQYDANKQDNNDHRRDSGEKNAFTGTDEQRAKRNTNLPANHPDWTSAEETMRASARLGGWGSPVVPVDPDQNKAEGGRFSGQLTIHNVQDGDYIKESFVGLNPNMKYCNAYMAKPPDTSVCSQPPKDGDDPIQLIVQKTNTKKSNAWQYKPMQYGVDTWASFRLAKGMSIVKRDYIEDVFDTEAD